jgi:hypothetical protein
MSFPKILLNIILIFLFIGWELSGLSGKFLFNPLICLIIFYALNKNKFYFIWPLIAGPILDLFSIFNFPIFTFSFIIIFIVIKFIAGKILTFKNHISYIIFSGLSILIYNLTFVAINFISYLIKLDNFLIVFNHFYFLYFIFNIIFVFLLLIAFHQKYDRPILHS